MPATIPRIQTALWSPNSDNLNQAFFNSAFAGRLSQDPLIKETYWCNIIGEPNLSAFLDEYTGYSTFCYPDFSTAEYNMPYYDQAKNSDSQVVVAAYPAYTTITLDSGVSQLGGTYILPQVGNYLVAPPYGAFLKVISVSPSTPSISVQQVDQTGAAITIPAGTEMKVLAGKYLADCECPSGQFRFPGMPIIAELNMKILAADSGELCGDALYACQHTYLPFFTSDGQETKLWWNEPLAQMYRDHEKAKLYARLLDPNWGLIPTLVARGGVWTTAYPGSVSVSDVYAWGTALTLAGVTCRDFAIFAGRDLFVQFQQLLNQEGVEKIIYGVFGQDDSCKWLNLNWCGLSVGGLNLHIYEEPWMSSGLALGGSSYNFRKAGIAIPLCDRSSHTTSTVSNSGYAPDPTNKMLTTVYFKEANGGRIHDNLTDGNGIYGPRNTFGAGCDKQEWTVKSRFSQIIHCPQAWGLINFL